LLIFDVRSLLLRQLSTTGHSASPYEAIHPSLKFRMMKSEGGRRF